MRFDALDVAVEINRAVAAPVAKIAQHDADLARQIRRAAPSIPLNIAEAHRRVGKDRLHLFRIAAGSTAEVRAALQVALAWGHVAAGAIVEVLELLDREQAMLWRLVHPR